MATIRHLGPAGGRSSVDGAVPGRTGGGAGPGSGARHTLWAFARELA
ncbi:hypothetical protein AB0C11_06800 [Streptomyces sp. NPDC039016]